MARVPQFKISHQAYSLLPLRMTANEAVCTTHCKVKKVGVLINDEGTCLELTLLDEVSIRCL